MILKKKKKKSENMRSRAGMGLHDVIDPAPPTSAHDSHLMIQENCRVPPELHYNHLKKGRLEEEREQKPYAR